MARMLCKGHIIYALYGLLIFVASLKTSEAQVTISLFNDYSVKTLVFSVTEGDYKLQIENIGPFEINKSKNIYISLVGDIIYINGLESNVSGCKLINLIPINDSCKFSIRPVFPAMENRNYEGKLSISVDFNRLLMVNTVDYVSYIAGVVQAEGGTNADEEFYKVQSILCQTYLLKNIERHSSEGFSLCDGTHCQAFNGYSTSEKIIDAVIQTKDKVVIDKDSALITAAFHSNSGGQTESSKNVWLVDLPYLQQVADPYALKGKNVSWQKTITLKEWKNYLSANGLNNIVLIESNKFNFIQDQRRQFYVIGDFSIPVKKIREDWNLKSSFFSIKVAADKVIFDGKGYGHGVGLCQEGAMQMALAGYTYQDIIKFYFQGVKIISSGGL